MERDSWAIIGAPCEIWSVFSVRRLRSRGNMPLIEVIGEDTLKDDGKQSSLNKTQKQCS